MSFRCRGLVVLLSVVSLGSAGVAGCSSGQLKPATGLDPADQLFSDAEIKKLPAGPVRALDQWWHFIQYNDLTGYLSMLAPSLRAREMNNPLIDYILPVSARALDVAVPYVQSIDVHGRTATIYALLAYHQLVGASQFTTVEVPQAFSMTQVGGRWYVADDRFVVEQSRPSLISAGVLPAAVAPGTRSRRGATAAAAAAAAGQVPVPPRTRRAPTRTTAAPQGRAATGATGLT